MKKKIIIIYIMFFSIGIFFKKYISDNYIINTTNSLQKGIYKIVSNQIKDIKKGDIIVFIPPKDTLQKMKKRGYIQEKVTFLMKIYAADINDKIEIRNDFLYINDKNWGIIKKSDSLGRKLPKLKKENIIPKKDEVLALSPVDNSFDGRYFGMIKKNSILYKVKLVLAFS